MGITYGKKDKVFRQYGKPSLLLDFARRKKLLDTVSKKNPITFTRASSVATYVDADGLIKLAPVNLALYSEQFDNAYWPKAAVWIDANQAIAPDGKQTADKMIATATTANHLLNKVVTFPVVTGKTYTHSLYLKAGEYSFARLQFQSPGFTSSTWANFNLSSGTVATTGGAAYVQASIESVGDGWYRCSITATASATTSTGLQPFVLDADRGGTSPSFLGDGTSGIYIWGAQLEEGTTATPYIKTTSTMSGAPRFDHDPVTGESKGLLIEEARTNYRTYSFGNSTSLKKVVGNFTIEDSTDITAPDGTNTTRKVTSPGGGQHSIDALYAQGNILTSDSIYTVSCYYYATGESESSRTIGIRYPFSSYSGAIVLPKNQWVRKSLTFTHNGQTYQQLRVIDNDTGGFTQSSGSTIYLWGVQIEAGAFPTS